MLRGLDLWGMRPSYVNALEVHRRAWRIGFGWGTAAATFVWLALFVWGPR